MKGDFTQIRTKPFVQKPLTSTLKSTNWGKNAEILDLPIGIEENMKGKRWGGLWADGSHGQKVQGVKCSRGGWSVRLLQASRFVQ